MRIQFKFRNIEPSDAIKEYATDKLTKLQKYLRAPLDVEVTLSVERYLHGADVHLSAHDGESFVGREESEDMYASIDGVVEKLEKQVEKVRSKRIEKRRIDAGRAKRRLVADAEAALHATPVPPEIVRVKRFAMKPMTAERRMSGPGSLIVIVTPVTSVSHATHRVYQARAGIRRAAGK
jgi:putative sigma-54 modulation protein